MADMKKKSLSFTEAMVAISVGAEILCLVAQEAGKLEEKPHYDDVDGILDQCRAKELKLI